MLRRANSRFLMVVLAVLGCGTSESATNPELDPPRPAALAVLTAPSGLVENRSLFSRQPIVQVETADGTALAKDGIEVQVQITTGGGALDGTTTVQTDAAGQAAFSDLSIRGPIGPQTLNFSSPGLASATAVTSLTSGPLDQLNVHSGADQSGIAGEAVAIAPAVIVLDGDDNPIEGVEITFSVSEGGGQVTGSTTYSDAAGVGTVGSWTLGELAGANTLVATVSTPVELSVEIDAIGEAGPPSTIVPTAGQGQVVEVFTTLPVPPTVRLEDRFGNPVPDVSVTFTTGGASHVSSGAGFQNSVNAVTNHVGTASVAWRMSQMAGEKELTVTAPGLDSPIVFSATALPGDPDHLVMVTQPPVSVHSCVPLLPQPVVAMRDQYGNAVPLAGIPVEAEVYRAVNNSGFGATVGSAEGTTIVTTDGAGVAVFDALTLMGTEETWQGLRFKVEGLGSAHANLVSMLRSPPAKLVILVEPSPTATSGSWLAQQPVVALRDACDREVSFSESASVSVTLSPSPPGVLEGATQYTLRTDPVAFQNLAITGPDGSYTLTFSATGLGPYCCGHPPLMPVVSDPIAVRAP